MSYHAEEELHDDNLEIEDLENVILKGFIKQKQTKDTGQYT